MTMLADAIRLGLFPAMMAFAASSDLLTMTISNRVSLILLGGFFALALAGGMDAADALAHLGAGGLVLVLAFGLFARDWIGGGVWPDMVPALWNLRTGKLVKVGVTAAPGTREGSGPAEAVNASGVLVTRSMPWL